MDEQITIDQHYVPRFYMRNFAINKGEGKKEKSLISFFNLIEKYVEKKFQLKVYAMNSIT